MLKICLKLYCLHCPDRLSVWVLNFLPHEAGPIKVKKKVYYKSVVTMHHKFVLLTPGPAE